MQTQKPNQTHKKKKKTHKEQKQMELFQALTWGLKHWWATLQRQNGSVRDRWDECESTSLGSSGDLMWERPFYHPC